ncbi:aldehyde dehydrogenase family protein [Pseudemcibacter sp.]|uniref:aldehyde dehydrogenase family protein n=1 Tax=Pseudemcibacter sp. TaxID=2943293 RepID=UPI002311CE79|nr:aldehyde dehydrogenase family protein [Emcibacteraceae bacterium]
MKFSFETDKILIAGKWRNAENNETIDVFNPSTGEVLCKVARGSAKDIDEAVLAAQAAMDGEWGRMTALERGRILTKIGEKIKKYEDELTEIESHDVGKPFKQARADAIAMARYFEFYGGSADKVMGHTIPYMEGYTVYTLREPHGVTGHIVPWNYPMQITGRCVGGALAMGNTCVLKPSEEACLTALLFARIAEEAGLPKGVLNVVPGFGAEAGAALSSHPGVHHISFTGSVGVGKLVQKAAGDNIVPVTLELGGKSPQIVFDDADLDAALPFLVAGGIQNAGQTCSAGTRILAQSGIYEKLIEMMSEKYKALQVGKATDDLDVGPLISAKQLNTVKSYIEAGEKSGLKIAAQGSIVYDAPENGNYVSPTLFRDVSNDHKLAQEEIFGPVQVVIPFDSEEEAIKIANGTEYGLVTGVWTRDGGRQLRMAKAVKAGQLFINNYGAGGGVELPFGGIGKSGFGREKGFEALYGFSVLKTVAVNHG